MIQPGKRDFDKDAATWDSPARVKLAHEIFEAIWRAVPDFSGKQVLDFGCGTGLLSMRFFPQAASVTGLDTSQGMLDVFRNKLKQEGLANGRTQFFDFEKGKPIPGHYDLIVSSMTLHHIQDTARLLAAFYEALLPGGMLALADLDLEEGLFHTDPAGVYHNGFDREILRKLFGEAGFKNRRVQTAAQVVKPGFDGIERTFTIFLITGEKEKS